MAYFGPASEARSYFVNMGYEPANRQTTADFLVAVTDPNGRIPRPDMHISMLPSTAEEYAIHFCKSDHARENRAAIEAYKAEFVGKPQLKESYAVSAQDEHSKHTRKASPYLISWAMQARAVAIRRIKMLKGDWLALGLNTL
jgi:ATP-binding cassette, subfamily G (WHITE), member 2, SNQ2